ncbi:MAG: M48 family metallopeptidase [Isosphaeraceae bacterium]|nr:M48 family metallopeptidase [Isosphaeraceae bacterium]
MSYGGAYYDEPSQNRGPNLRLVAALIVAAFGFIIYMTHTEVNPVTGKKQHIGMSVDQEKALGLEAAPEMAAKMGGAIDPRRDPRAAFVARVGRKLVELSEARSSPYADNFHFYLLDDPQTVNAFALPGGQIFITEGLYDKLADEAELAGVLGHEIGHVVNRHAAEQMAKGRLGEMLTLAVGIGASGDRRGQSAAMAAAMVNQMSQLHFSRDDESEADRYGLRYMAQAGYDPSAMMDVMKVLIEASKGTRQPEILATHPNPGRRLEEIRSILGETYPSGVPDSFTRGRPLR